MKSYEQQNKDDIKYQLSPNRNNTKIHLFKYKLKTQFDEDIR